jgi:hypothetical protein
MTRMTLGLKSHDSNKINLPGKRGGEHNSLAVGPAVVDDPHDLGLQNPITPRQNPPGKCGGEHNSLAVGAAVVNDPHDLGLQNPMTLRQTHLGNVAENMTVWRSGRQLSMTPPPHDLGLEAHNS